MKTLTILPITGLLLAIVSLPAAAGGASSAASGPGSVGGATGSAGSDGSGRLTKINQYSVKSYTLMRQIVVASGAKTAAPAEPPPAAR